MSQIIKASVQHLINKHDTRDPEKIAKGEGIEIIEKEYSKGTKGYFININGKRYIVINKVLDRHTRKVLISHELGHAIHHNEYNIYFIREHTHLSTKVYENEANAFAAEPPIDSEDIDEVALREMTIDQISSHLKVTPTLADYRIRNKDLDTD